MDAKPPSPATLTVSEKSLVIPTEAKWRDLLFTLPLAQPNRYLILKLERQNKSHRDGGFCIPIPVRGPSRRSEIATPQSCPMSLCQDRDRQ